MLDGAVAQPLQNWPLGRLSLIQQGVINVTSLLGFRLQVSGLAQISLVSQHNEKFCLLSIGCLFRHPRRNLGRSRRRTGDRRSMLVADSTRGGNGSYGSDNSCDEKQ